MGRVQILSVCPKKGCWGRDWGRGRQKMREARSQQRLMATMMQKEMETPPLLLLLQSSMRGGEEPVAQ